MNLKRRSRAANFIAAFLVAIALAAYPSDAIERVMAKDKTITLHEHGGDHSYEFDDEELVLSEISSVKLLFQNHVKDRIYLLLHVSGPSTGGGNGQCGAGEEEYLIWMALDAKWQRNDQKLELIDSCFFNVQSTSSESFSIKQGKLVAEYDRYTDGDGTRSTLTYDSATPEKGWQITHKPTPPTPQ